MIKLKPCPFCGGEAHFNVTYSRKGVEHWDVQCLECKAVIWRYPTQKDAARDWNRRDNILKRLLRCFPKLRRCGL